MNYLLLSLKRSFFIVLLFTAFFSEAQSIATYDFTFTSVWNSTDHGALPFNPHWSDLVGTTHNSTVKFWEIGQTASPGIKDVAEEGNNINIRLEIDSAINANNAGIYLEGFFSPFAAISSATLTNVEVDINKPLLTLVSMIAPSPDWFIGVDSYSLIDNEGDWKGEVPLVIDIFSYVAGTDAGTSYEADNIVNIPPLPISNIGTQYGFNGQKIGTLTITLKGIVLGIEDEIAKKNAIKIFPNPTSSLITVNNLNNYKTIELYDLTGKPLFNKSLNQISNYSFDTNQYNKGLYFIKLTDNKNNSNIKRILIQ